MKRLLAFTISILMATPFFAQELTPTETEAHVMLKTTDMQGKTRKFETIVFTDLESGKNYEATTDENGRGEMLIPKGRKYDIGYKSIGFEADYSEVEIPNQPGMMSFEVEIQFEEGQKVYTLDNVFFDTGKATLKKESFEALNTLYEVMKNKKTLVIEVAGHTDSDGDADMNMKLSKRRAEAVRKYLIQKGIETNRVKAEGYGETQPVASNDNPQGKAKNRRTEVRIISE